MAGSQTLEFTDANFEKEVLQSDKPVLVDFWAEWCAPCKALGPVIDELARDNADKVKIGKVNTESNSSVTVQYSVSAIPTVILFHRGKVVDKFVGLRQKKEFQTAIDRLSAA
jgi:thioredoxin 1